MEIHKKILGDNYYSLIEETLFKLTNINYDIKFVLEEEVEVIETEEQIVKFNKEFESYDKAIHAILTSSSILIIVTLIIALFSSAIASKICRTISAGTICSTILILLMLPPLLAGLDRFIVKKEKIKSKKKVKKA